MAGQGYKRCPKCGETKAFEAFYKRSASPDGRQGWCVPCQRQRVKDWKQENPVRLRELSRRERERHPGKSRARGLVKRFVRERRIVKPDLCEGCRKATEVSKLHGHHEDYSRPLDVEWLCQGCHAERHGKLKSSEGEP